MLLLPRDRLPSGGLLGTATCVGECDPLCFFLPDSSLLNRPREGVPVLVDGAGLLLGQPCGVVALPCPAASCQAAEELTSPGPGDSESDTSPELLHECCLPGLILPPMPRRCCRSLESAAVSIDCCFCRKGNMPARELRLTEPGVVPAISLLSIPPSSILAAVYSRVLLDLKRQGRWQPQQAVLVPFAALPPQAYSSDATGCTNIEVLL